MLAVYTIVEVAEHGWGSAADARPRRRRGSPCSPASSPARRPRRSRSSRCGSSARATRRRRTSSRCSWSPGCSACSSSARSTCSACSATTRSTSASRSCPSRSRSARCRSASSARLIMRFGARATLIPGLALAGAGLLLFARAPRRRRLPRDLLPAMLLLGIGAGLAFPALTSLAMSGATPSESGLASGLFQTTQQVGAALGLAVLATLADHAHGRPLRRRRNAARRAHGRLPPGVRDRRAARRRGARRSPSRSCGPSRRPRPRPPRTSRAPGPPTRRRTERPPVPWRRTRARCASSSAARRRARRRVR